MVTRRLKENGQFVSSKCKSNSISYYYYFFFFKNNKYEILSDGYGSPS